MVKELNITWGRNLGVQLELIDWKTHAWPGFGSDPQAVINAELGEEYDIFFGIMWTRFGEPTPRAGSGTAEEFNRALERWKEDPNQLRIMCYFKNAPPASLRDLDPSQLAAVREFQARIDGEGGLYAEFSNSKEFESYVRMHLSKQVQEWGKTWGELDNKNPARGTEPLADIKSTIIPTAIVEEVKDDEEEGFMDLIEQGQESFEMLDEILSRMTAEMESYRRRLDERNVEIHKLVESSADIKQRKRVVNSTAGILDQYSLMLEGDVPQFSNAYTTAVNSIARAVSIWSEDITEGADEVRNTYNQMKNLRLVLTETNGSMTSMKGSVDRLPRATSVFNRSKKRLSAALEKLIAEMSSGINLTQEIESQFRRILGNPDGA
ncbi:MAG: hypothetical protein AABN95_14895 [Acidobacteriota bacterium]